MKRLYKPFRWATPEGVGQFLVLVFVARILIRLYRGSGDGLGVMSNIAFLLIGWSLIGLMAKGCEWLFCVRAFDDGDAIVFKKRSVACTVPFNDIIRVERILGEGQRVRVQWRTPCHFGTEQTIVLSRQSSSSAHCEIADDLHRRSRCCKEEQPPKELISDEAHITPSPAKPGTSARPKGSIASCGGLFGVLAIFGGWGRD